DASARRCWQRLDFAQPARKLWDSTRSEKSGAKKEGNPFGSPNRQLREVRVPTDRLVSTIKPHLANCFNAFRHHGQSRSTVGHSKSAAPVTTISGWWMRSIKRRVAAGNRS